MLMAASHSLIRSSDGFFQDVNEEDTDTQYPDDRISRELLSVLPSNYELVTYPRGWRPEATNAFKTCIWTPLQGIGHHASLVSNECGSQNQLLPTY